MNKPARAIAAGVVAAVLTLGAAPLAVMADDLLPEEPVVTAPEEVTPPAEEAPAEEAPAVVEEAPPVEEAPIVEPAAAARTVAPLTEDRLAICHTGSGANWTFIAPDASGYNGHQHHDADVYGLTEGDCLAKNSTGSYTVALWKSDDTTAPYDAWPQHLIGYVPTSDLNLRDGSNLDLATILADVKGCGYFQADVYADGALTTALLTGGVLTSPGNPTEVWPGGSYQEAYSLTWSWTDCPPDDEEPPVTNKVCEVVADGPTSTDLVDLWGNYDTRSKGHVEYVDGGLHVWTDDNSSQAKVSEYIPVSIPLSEVGELDITALAQPGNVYPYGPGLNLLLDITEDGVPDGTLVYEEVYGQDLWVTNGSAQAIKDASVHTGGNGSENHGTINQFLLTFPDADIVGLAYALGSGVQGDWIIQSITAGCVEYTFDKVDQPTIPEPEVVVTSTEWTEGEPTCEVQEVQQTREVTTTTTPYKVIVSEGGYQVVPDVENATSVTVTETRTATWEGEDCPTPVVTENPAPPAAKGLADTGAEPYDGWLFGAMGAALLGTLLMVVAGVKSHRRSRQQ